MEKVVVRSKEELKAIIKRAKENEDLNHLDVSNITITLAESSPFRWKMKV
jgi:hypothetical protein